MLNKDETVIFFEGIATQIDMGILLSSAIDKMATSIPGHSKTIHSLANELRDGKGLGELLMQYDLLPDEYHSQIVLGEDTGTLPEVLNKMARHIEEYNNQLKATYKQLMLPAFIAFFALVVLLGFMLFVFPMYAKNLPLEQQQSGLFYVSSLFVDVFDKTPWVYALPLVVIGYFTYLAKVNLRFRKAVFKLSLSFPYYGRGMELMMIAAWCTNSAIAIRAGLRVYEAMRLSNKSLTDEIAEPFQQLVNEAEKGDWNNAINTNNWQRDDLRHLWPLELVSAISVGGENGKLDVMLPKAAKKLILKSEREVSKGVALATSIAFGIAVICIVILGGSLIMASTSGLKGI